MRELEHVISRAALKLLSRGANRNEILTLEPEQLDLDSGASPAASAVTVPVQTAEGRLRPLRDSVDDCQRQAIQQALAASENNWANAARLLDLDPSNLHKLAKRLRMK
ncbi:Nitric oxide reductase transcription regulator NorR2 [compost metagenome]